MTNSKLDYRLLILVGLSGTGKTYMSQELEDYEGNDMFYKMKQVTTRDMRENEKQGDPYLFINHDFYDDIKESLIFRVQGDNKYNNLYGTMFEYVGSNTWHIAIVSQEGYNDFVDNSLDSLKNEYNLIHTVIGIHADESEWETLRAGRDKDLLQEESKFILSVSDKIFNVKPSEDQYVNKDDIIDYLNKL